MKKLILLFALLFSVSSSFISCRETTEEVDDIEATEEVGEDTDLEEEEY